MADEITVTTTLAWSNGGAQIRSTASYSETQVGRLAIQNAQLIQGTSETLDFGDVDVANHIMFKNLNKKFTDLTDAQKSAYSGKADYETKNTVHIGNIDPTTSVNAIIHLKPQVGAVLQNSGVLWYACKSTDSVALEVVAIQA